MSDLREHAKSLSEAPAELIRQILDKHHEAVLEMLKAECDKLKAVRTALKQPEAKTQPKLVLKMIDVIVNGSRENTGD